MNLLKREVDGKEYFLGLLDIPDLLKDNSCFKTNYRASFNEIFSEVIYSSTKFRLYIYQLYKRQLRGYYLAKWIVEHFIRLLYRDLVEQNDTFKFPHKQIFLSVKDANEYRRKWKYYVPKLYGKHYKLFMTMKDPLMFAKLDKKYYYKLRDIGINNPYV